MPREAREPGFEVAVEVEQGGRPSSFDGNFSSELDAWLVIPRGHEPGPGDLRELMRWTLAGHLSWAVFPVDVADEDEP